MMNKKELKNKLEKVFQSYTYRTHLNNFTIEALAFMRLNKPLLKSISKSSRLRNILRSKKDPTSLIDIKLILGLLLGNKVVFQAFRESLHPEVRVVLDILVWSSEVNSYTLKEDFDIQTVTQEKVKHTWTNKLYYRTVLINRFRIFHQEIRHYRNEPDDFALSLPLEIRQILVSYYDKPETAKITPLQDGQLAATQYTFESEIPILTELLRLYTYYKQDYIKVTTKGIPSVTTLNKMRKGVGIKEFYDSKSKSLTNLRTHLLANIIVYVDAKIKLDVPAKFIKWLFTEFQTTLLSYHTLLPQLSGMNYINNFNYVEPYLWQLMQQLPKNGDWVTSQNLVEYVKYHFLDLFLVSEADYDYYLKLNTVKDGKKIKVSVDGMDYQKVITESLVKGCVFLFAAYGLVDIKYDDVGEIDGVEIFSPFDGLKYVRLNDLGNYVLGHQSSYTSKTQIQKHSITLSDDGLMVVVDDGNTVADILLKGYVQRVGKNRYHTDATIFMQDCKTQKDLDTKISFFKTTVAAELPTNWKHFFEQLEYQANPFQKVTTNIVLKIPAENKTLIHLIAKDVKLKKCVLRAEDFHIIVFKDKLTVFKKRLRELGYLMD